MNESEIKTAEPKPFIPADWIACIPTCPPLVGGFGTETPEAKEAREARGDPPPKPLLMTAKESHEAEHPKAAAVPAAETKASAMPAKK